MHPYNKNSHVKPKQVKAKEVQANTPLEWVEVGENVLSSTEKVCKKLVFARSGELNARSLVCVTGENYITRIPLREKVFEALLHGPGPCHQMYLNCSSHSYLILPLSSDTVLLLYGRDGIWFRNGISLTTNEILRLVRFDALWKAFELETSKFEDIVPLWVQIIVSNLYPKERKYFDKVETTLNTISQSLGVDLKFENQYHPLFNEMSHKYSQPGPHQAGIEILKQIINSF